MALSLVVLSCHARETAPSVSLRAADASPYVPPEPRPIAKDADLRVTRGELAVVASPNDATRELLRIEGPTVRAVLREKSNEDGRSSIALRFTYNGPTQVRAALGSGEEDRVQIGAKLRAADGCNVVYAMLRLHEKEPASIVVQVKHNPSAHTHAECSNHGYRAVKPTQSSTLRSIEIGTTHLLRAEMNGRELVVWLDDHLVWKGDVGPEALAFDGPAGFRTDNGRFLLEVIR